MMNSTVKITIYKKKERSNRARISHGASTRGRTLIQRILSPGLHSNFSSAVLIAYLFRLVWAGESFSLMKLITIIGSRCSHSLFPHSNFEYLRLIQKWKMPKVETTDWGTNGVISYTHIVAFGISRLHAIINKYYVIRGSSMEKKVLLTM